MKTAFIIGGLLILNTMPSAQRSNLVRAADNGINYKKMAAAAEWKWSEQATNPFYCSLGKHGEFSIVIAVPPDRGLTDPGLSIDIRKEEKSVFKFLANPKTVFSLNIDRLTYVAFSPFVPGGEVVHVDLTSGKELWRSPLAGLAPGGAFFNYVTRFNLEQVNPDVVLIWGKESAGRYLEVKSLRTGETIGHKVFPKDAKNEANSI